jgi:hypothetical protein
MKNKSNCIIQSLFSFLFILINGIAFSQSSDNYYDTLKIASFQEKLLIHTDRDIYMTGEQVWVKVYKMDRLTGIPSDLSKVVYLELLDNSNNTVNQIKIWTPGTSGSTGFRLSDTLSSGNYLIRAYTKWMTNYSEDLFFYKTLTIINPFKNIDRLITPIGGQVNNKGISSLTENQSAGEVPDYENENQINIKAIPQKNEYLAREKVMVDISVTDLAGNPVETDLSVSIVKPALLHRESMNHAGYRDTLNGVLRSVPVNLPEIEGPLLSGIIKSNKTNEPLKNIDLSLSFVGKSARCQFVKTNDKGEFNFVLREQLDISDLVIQPLFPEMSDSYVELNQPFCTTFSETKPKSYFPDSSRMESISNAVISMQVNNIYEPFRQRIRTLPMSAVTRDFYGEPDRRILMSDYIELKNVKEIVKEILPEINVIKRNKKFSFKIINSYPYQPFENQALILVDGIPVYDIENLLNVSSKDLERIDIINRRYYLSDYIFDGIVSFTTKKGNMSALESDKFVYRQVFEGYKPKYDFYSPDYSIDSLRVSHIPDFRNTLFWKPDLKSAADGKASVMFFTSDETGVYTIIVEGITTAGEKGLYSFPLNVK